QHAYMTPPLKRSVVGFGEREREGDRGSDSNTALSARSLEGRGHICVLLSQLDHLVKYMLEAHKGESSGIAPAATLFAQIRKDALAPFVSLLDHCEDAEVRALAKRSALSLAEE